jgi:predicted ABC-type ATPase
MRLTAIFCAFKSEPRKVATTSVTRTFVAGISALANLPAAIQVADIAVIFDNSGNKRRRSLEFEHGSIVWRDEKLPRWLTQALPHLKP